MKQRTPKAYGDRSEVPGSMPFEKQTGPESAPHDHDRGDIHQRSLDDNEVNGVRVAYV